GARASYITRRVPWPLRGSVADPAWDNSRSRLVRRALVCMRSRAEIHQARADTCRHRAKLAKDTSERDRLLELADQWLKMAEEAKRQPSDRRAISIFVRKKK